MHEHELYWHTKSMVSMGMWLKDEFNVVMKKIYRLSFDKMMSVDNIKLYPNATMWDDRTVYNQLCISQKHN